MKKIGLVPRLIIAITLGILLGLVLPSPVLFHRYLVNICRLLFHL